ncbi:hypothetical protein Micbo1qcDRAFT_224173 [Microdochium bolleyi]|uniref:Uncharacterized protein n=1 Tax=Microdochium bolleyi TaxID=196109 RepID=A0A136J4Z5_9PEZI|nr:hypothetical protein Micbo1qcDRAFT_224173 [Microdochium bolleyi]
MPNFLDDSFLSAPIEAQDEPVTASPFDHLYRQAKSPPLTERHLPIEQCIAALTIEEGLESVAPRHGPCDQDGPTPESCANLSEHLKSRRPRLAKGPTEPAVLLDPSTYSKAKVAFRQAVVQMLVDQMKPHFRDEQYSIKVAFGHLMLQTWKDSSTSVANFAVMLDHPRTIATVPEEFGNAKMAAAIISAIQADTTGLFTPSDGKSALPAETVPFYRVEAQVPTGRLVADVLCPAAGHDSGYYLDLERLHLPQPTPILQLQVLRLGKAIDWMVEIVSHDDSSRPPTKKAFTQAKIYWDRDTVGDFPRLRGCPNLKGLTVKTMYEFQWWQESMDYVIEVTIIRRWDTSWACAQGKEPAVSLSLTMRGGSCDSISKENVGDFITHVQTVARLIGDMTRERQ